MRTLIFIAPFFLLASCGVYKNQFDCPPGKGIGCASVGEVLDLIVEKEEGEDVFVNNKGTALLLKQQEESRLERSIALAKKQKTFLLIKDESGNLKLVKANEANKK